MRGRDKRNNCRSETEFSERKRQLLNLCVYLILQFHCTYKCQLSVYYTKTKQPRTINRQTGALSVRTNCLPNSFGETIYNSPKVYVPSLLRLLHYSLSLASSGQTPTLLASSLTRSAQPLSPRAAFATVLRQRRMIRRCLVSSTIESVQDMLVSHVAGCYL